MDKGINYIILSRARVSSSLYHAICHAWSCYISSLICVFHGFDIAFEWLLACPTSARSGLGFKTVVETCLSEIFQERHKWLLIAGDVQSVLEDWLGKSNQPDWCVQLCHNRTIEDVLCGWYQKVHVCILTCNQIQRFFIIVGYSFKKTWCSINKCKLLS